MNRPLATRGNARDNGAAARQECAQRDTGALAATLERVAALHAELSAAYRELATGIEDIQLAASPEPSLMAPVEARAPGPDLLTADDLAERLRVSARTVRRWRSERRLPDAIEIAGVLRWRAADVERWLAETRS